VTLLLFQQSIAIRVSVYDLLHNGPGNFLLFHFICVLDNDKVIDMIFDYIQ